MAIFINCAGDKNTNGDVNDEQAIFPKGELGSATNFTGNAYNFGLLSNDSIYNTLIGNVYFEKSAIKLALASKWANSYYT